MGEAFAAAIAGRLHPHQPGVEPVLEIALEDAILDQHGAPGRGTLVVDRQAPAAARDRALVDHGDAGRGHALTNAARESRQLLAVEIALEPVADRFMEQHAGPAGAAHHLHLARRRGDRFQIDQRLRQRGVDTAVPGRGIEQMIVEIAPAEPEAAGFAAVAILRHDRDVEADHRADVAGNEPAGADDVDHAPAARQRDADLVDPGIARAGGGVDLGAQPDLVGERNRRQRIVGAVHRLVGAWRGGGWLGLRRIEQAQGRGGAVDRGGADFIGVGEGGGLASHAAQPEARGVIVIGGLQPAIVEAERFAQAVLQIQLAIVVARQMPGRETLGLFGIQRAIEKGARVAHWAMSGVWAESAGPPSSRKRRSQ